MTSTPSIIALLRSNVASDRPVVATVQEGEVALCYEGSDPGLYFEDTAGAIRKIGPAGYGTTAPNAAPAGLAGNSVGELWTDSTGAMAYLKVWTGATWKKVDAGFADTSASTISGAYAIQAGSALVASGAVLASGAIQSFTSILASGAVRASGSVGALLASGAIQSSGSIQASGALLASGAYITSTVVLSGLPNPANVPSGVLYYQIQPSGAFNAGLYVRASNTWLQA